MGSQVFYYDEGNYIEGNHNVMKNHWYMFDEKLDYILNRIVREKQYWILTIDASRQYFESNHDMVQHENDVSSIEKQFSTVPD